MNEMRKRIDLEKLKRLEAYEEDFRAVIRDYKFEPGDLVLVRNTAIENSLDKKMKPRYNGPFIVVQENKGGSYILAELTGAVWHQKVAKFRVVPYFARRRLDIPGGIMSILDTSKEKLEQLRSLPEEDLLATKDYLMDDVRMNPDNLEAEINDIFE